MLKREIENIIFDFGGVIINIDYHRTEEAFINLGVTDFGRLFSQARQTDLFDLLETGLSSPEEFCDGIRSITGLGLSNQNIFDAWNAMILDLPLNHIQLLEKINNKYRIFLLSNTNEIHYRCYTDQIRNGFPSINFYGLFEKVYFSHQMGMRKPDVEIFEAVIHENNLDPKKTLFIDDSIQHVHGAAKAGLHSLHLTEGMDICDVLSCSTYISG